MAHADEIDRIRSRVWLAQLRASTGLEATHALASRLDPQSVWRDGEGIPHQSKWYRFSKGTAVPSESLTKKVKAQAPAVSFDLHHPVWALLRHPNSSERTIARLKAKMPATWRNSLSHLINEPCPYRRINLDLVEKYCLTEFSYLDVLLLLELARRDACDSPSENEETLAFVILAAPLIFVHDPLWTYQNPQESKATLMAIERSLKASEYHHFNTIRFPIDRLYQAICMQKVLMKRYSARRKTGSLDSKEQTRVLAKFLCADQNGPYQLATAAFEYQSSHMRDIRYRFLESESFTSSFLAANSYSQDYWNWGWHRLKVDPAFRHFSQCLVRSVL